MLNNSRGNAKISMLPFALVGVLLLIFAGAFVFRAIQVPKAKFLLGLDAKAFVIPKDNTMLKQKIQLGHLLYFDKRLSTDNSISCASCHAPDKAFTDNAAVSTGVNGQKGGRSAPTVINRGFSTIQFWDGRAASLEEQAVGPLMNPIEHGFGSPEEVVERVSSIRLYKTLFKKTFARDVNIEDIGKAIATFERTITSGNSPFDKYQDGDKTALNEQQVRGLELFNGKARCATCHSGFNFTDEDFHNLGVGMNRSNPDLGRYAVTKNENDKGAFKTPTLREITKTAPYMHDGSIATLKEVVSFYNVGGHPNQQLSPLVEPLNLSGEEESDIIEFLKSLEGEGWQQVSEPGTYMQ